MKTNPMSSEDLAAHVQGCALVLSIPLDNSTKLTRYERTALLQLVNGCNALVTMIQTVPDRKAS